MFTLKVFQQRSYEEIAEITGSSFPSSRRICTARAPRCAGAFNLTWELVMKCDECPAAIEITSTKRLRCARA